MTEYLVRLGERWHIATPAAIEDDTEQCSKCDGRGTLRDANPKIKKMCDECDGRGRVRRELGERTIRLAWAERDGSILAMDWQEPEVRRLPDD